MKLQQIMGVITCSLGTLAGGVLLFSQQASADDDASELAKQLQNPIANLISVPIRLDWDTDIGPEDADRYTYLVQPVIPITLNEKWNVISRTIVPVYIDAESPVAGGKDITGNGDIVQSFFFSPKAPTAGGWVWGAGPVFALPVASEDELGTDKYSLGPTAVVLKQESGWTYGALANHLWTIANDGDDNRTNVSATFLQPFFSFTTKKSTTYGLNTESTYDWKADEWTVPINATISQLTKIGKQPIQLQLGYRNYVDTPSGGPNWGLRFQLTFLFPK